MAVEDWLLIGLLGLSVLLAALGAVMYYVPRPTYPPVKISRHSLEDAERGTQRLKPPPPM
jgi:hypothetical protein